MFQSSQTALRRLAAAALTLTLALPATSLAKFEPGNALPDLASFHLEGTLPETLKGHVVRLDFWASWCAPCKSSFPIMEALQTKYAATGLTIVAVSVDEKPENMRRFLATENVNFTVVRDAQQKLVATADVATMPTSFLMDRTGKIRFVHVGFDRNRTAGEYAKEIDQLLQEPSP